MRPEWSKVKSAGSHAGFHYVNLWQNCPRKFFFQFVLRLLPVTVGKALIYGGAFHEAKAAWYLSGDMGKVLETFEEYMVGMRSGFADDSDFEALMWKGPILLEQWISEFGEDDLKYYDVVCVEKEVVLEIPETFDYVFTTRPDTVLRSKGNGKIIIMETKTSGSSWLQTDRDVRMGDQATAYTWAVQSLFPDDKIMGVQPDIAYWNSKSNSIDNIKLVRPELVYRTQDDVVQFIVGMKSNMEAIADGVARLYEGEDPVAAFPPNRSWCSAFFRECEYADVCRKNWKPRGRGKKMPRAPHGFFWDRMRKSRKYGSAAV